MKNTGLPPVQRRYTFFEGKFTDQSVGCRWYINLRMLCLGAMLAISTEALTQCEVTCEEPIEIDDPLSLATNHLCLMNLPCAWTITTGNPEITVAVVDQYFYYGHPELDGKLIYIFNEGDCKEPDLGSWNGHGMGSIGALAAIPNNEECVAGT